MTPTKEEVAEAIASKYLLENSDDFKDIKRDILEALESEAREKTDILEKLGKVIADFEEIENLYPNIGLDTPITILKGLGI